MTSIIDFIHARLNEDERGAQAAGGIPWVDDVPACVQVDPTVIRDNTLTYGHLGYVASTDASPLGDAYRHHIARQDPARTLRAVAAKRKLVESLAYSLDTSDRMERAGVAKAEWQALRVPSEYRLALIASEWSEHDDYQREWYPE